MRRGNPNPRTEFLVAQKTGWRHLPTKAVRVPQALESQVLEYARLLDSQNENQSIFYGFLSLEASIRQLESWSLEDLLELEKKLPGIIADKKEQLCDRRLEAAILHLARHCDGAYSVDGQGFNKADTSFGRWLSTRIQEKQSILRHHAEAALKMLQKYVGQLERGGLTLPSWELIAHQYPSHQELPLQQTEEGRFEKSPRRIEIKDAEVAVYAPYDATGVFNKKCKTIEGWRFNGSDKGWYFPLRNLDKVLDKFKDGYEIDPNIEGAIVLLQQQREEEQAAKEAEALELSNQTIDLIKAADLDAPLANGWHLRNYQKKGVEWLLAHRVGVFYRGGILADHMGLGKSLTSLVAARAMQRVHNCPVLVIAPVSVLENWRREAAKAEVRIECYSWAKLPKPLEKQPYVLICDESHYAQNFSSLRTQKMLELAKHNNCLASWLLTGTPIKNGRPINLFPLLYALDHPLALNQREYEKHYCNAHYKDVGKKTVWDTTGASYLAELSEKTKDIILRRTKDECLPELPAKTRFLEEIELESGQRAEYDEFVRLLVDDYKQRSQSFKLIKNLPLLFKAPTFKGWLSWVLAYNPVDKSAEALVTINILRKVGSHAKVEAAIAIAEELIEQGQSVVLFTEFVESAKAISKGLGVKTLVGETMPEERQAIVDAFQAGETKAFVGTIKAGGVGLTLTAASNVILVDRPWTPGDAEQSEDRCHRLGQKSAVFATWLQLGHIDRAIDTLLTEKQQRIELVLKGKAQTLEGINSPSELAKQLLEIL
ncbi:DEAD/DEAH box helicase [Iningainema tapete]|uniref:DEAD/DEAH box helicase n=1 Tax=Iningainema tapete BLCC-T55 TaxID=2748662 RepID=A0A8J7C9Y1_9CYAN|nr:DEAD/DEAH box helicase [Iningainema tapete]MBD2778649.1 DEAD/DEAH box helicase [Iningainema tapete BLCC-T55]